MLEPGPSEIFPMPQSIPSREPPLLPEDEIINVPGLAELDEDLGVRMDTLDANRVELHTTTFNLYEQLAVVEEELSGPGGTPPEPIPQEILDGIEEADFAMVDAAAKAPEIVSPPEPGEPLPIPPPPEPNIPGGPLPL